MGAFLLTQSFFISFSYDNYNYCWDWDNCYYCCWLGQSMPSALECRLTCWLGRG